MTLLANLYKQLESEPEMPAICSEKVGVQVESLSMAQVVARAPAINDHRAAPAPSSAPEVTSEPTRNAWTITRGGRPICRMVGAPCTHAEALAEARWRWPDADIE